MGEYNWMELKPDEDWRDRLYKERHALELRIQKLNQFLRDIKKRRPNEPEFDGNELSKALDWYAQRTRRFGKTTEQIVGGSVKAQAV
jgi:hypothetical protein